MEVYLKIKNFAEHLIHEYNVINPKYLNQSAIIEDIIDQLDLLLQYPKDPNTYMNNICTILIGGSTSDNIRVDIIINGHKLHQNDHIINDILEWLFNQTITKINKANPETPRNEVREVKSINLEKPINKEKPTNKEKIIEV